MMTMVGGAGDDHNRVVSVQGYIMFINQDLKYFVIWVFQARLILCI
jgi:hypothetical protein